ncbi:MAG: hypothetical protein QM778_10160 [Myxococcales bacterium]
MARARFETGWIEAAVDAAFGQDALGGRAGVDGHEGLTEHARGGHVEQRVLVDGVLDLVVDLQLDAHQRSTAGLGVELATEVNALLHRAHAHARDADRGAGLEAARVVEVHVHAVAALEVDASQREQEPAHQQQCCQQEQADFDL